MKQKERMFKKEEPIILNLKKGNKSLVIKKIKKIKLDDKKTEKEINFGNLPKNINEFRHVMQNFSCSVPEVEYILHLRRYSKSPNIKLNHLENVPSFYEKDFEKYKKRFAKNFEDKILLKTNIGKFRQLFSDKSKYAINKTQYKFEVTLREESKRRKEIPDIKRNRWDPYCLPRSKSLISLMLPPVLDCSKENFKKLEKNICRPLIKITKQGYVNGEPIRSNFMIYNKNLALRYPSEHFPSLKYSNDYGIKNYNSIRHIIDKEKAFLNSNWCTFLRGSKRVKVNPEEIKKREQRLREINDKKIYPKL